MPGQLAAGHDHPDVPQRAQMFHTVTNWKVARDTETQTLRRRMNLLLLACLAGMIGFALVVVRLDASRA